jgi:hypothetical protein
LSQLKCGSYVPLLDKKLSADISSELKLFNLTERTENKKGKLTGTYFKNDNRYSPTNITELQT